MKADNRITMMVIDDGDVDVADDSLSSAFKIKVLFK